MKKKFEHKESRGLPGGPNEMFTYVTGVFDIYQAPSNIEGQGMFAGKPFKKGDFIGLAHSNGQPASQLGRMHNHNENSPTMISKKSGNDRFVFAAKDLQPGDELTTNYRMQPELEQPEDFQFGGSITAPPRKGVRKNPDGSESTHLMATETLDGKNWFSFPTLFQDPDGTWIDMSDKPWKEAYEEAKRRGEVIEFGTDKEAAIKFGEGSWKLPKAQEGNGEVPLNRSEIFNIPRTMGYENGEMVLQDKPIWDGMLDEVTITPYTQSKLYGEYMMANKATGGLEPVYPIFDIMTLGLKAPATAGAKAIQAGIKKAPSKINPKYYNPNTLAKGDPSVYYRKAGKDAYEDFVNSGFVRTRAEVTDQPIMGLLDTKKEMDQVRKSIKEYGQFKYRHPSDFRAPYFSRGRTADMISGGDDYLFQTRPGLIGDDAFTSGQMNILHGRGKSQVVPGGYGIMDPMQRSADNFDVFKKSWWHGYKPIKQDGGSIPKAQEGIEVEPASRRIRYEDGRMKLQDPAIYDGMLNETTVTPYTQSELAFQEARANQATGGLEPTYPIFDVMTLGLRTPVTAGAKAVQAGIKKAPSKINPRYFQPNSNMYYRGIGREGMEDALESGLFRAKPSDKIPARMVDLGPNLGKVDMAKRFNKTYYSPRFNTADQYGAGYIAEVPKDAAKFTQRYQNTDWSMFTRDQIPVSEGRILEKNWWSGYKPIKAYGGSLPKAQDGNGETHTVASGETFFGIANKYKLDKQDLIDANPGLNIESIKAGQTINLPIIEKMEPIAISAADSKREPTSWMDYVNPYNWGVTDRDDDGTFNQAFRAARNAGEDEFMWYGTRYNTNLKPTPDKLEVEEVSNEVEKVKETGPFNDYTVTPELLYKQAFVESTLDPKVENAGGYKGLGQIGDKLITDYKKANKVDFVDPFDAKQNHDVQEWSMNELYNSSFIDKPGSTNEVKLIKALASYNWGRGYVRNLLEKQKAKGVDIYTDTAWTSELPKETRDYINMILYDGVTEKRPLVQENFKNALVDDTYKDIRNLYIYKSGGEKNEFQIYKDYIEGVYDGTEMEKPAEKIYDKLNRVYYKEAKKQGMRVPNYIMTNVIKQIDN